MADDLFAEAPLAARRRRHRSLRFGLAVATALSAVSVVDAALGDGWSRLVPASPEGVAAIGRPAILR